MLIIKKVPIDELIDVLTELYEKGVDYVDILATGEENKLSLVFNEDYVSEDMREEDVSKPKGKLSEDDLNQLI